MFGSAILSRARRLWSTLHRPSLDELIRRERSVWHRGPTFVLSFDVELRADCLALPAVVVALQERSILGSFACIGAWLEEYPDEHRVLAQAGHELLNHTDRHPSHEELGTRQAFHELTDSDLRREVIRADTKLRALGVVPIGFRSPHFASQHTARVYPLLATLGMAYSSSTLAAFAPFGAAPFRQSTLWEFPVLMCPRHPGAPLDSWHCTTAPGALHLGRDLVALYEDVLDDLLRYGAFGCVYWDPRVVERPEYVAVLDLLARFRARGQLSRFADLLPLS